MSDPNPNIGKTCFLCGKLWLPGPNGEVYHDCATTAEQVVTSLRAEAKRWQDEADLDAQHARQMQAERDALRKSLEAIGAVQVGSPPDYLRAYTEVCIIVQNYYTQALAAAGKEG